jgi:putative ABC transport system ATP-binding protein
MDAIIQLDNLQKSYFMGTQAIPVLKGITLDIFRNEYVALMGPSGSGKSTLMNILGCLDSPTGGKYVLNGKDVSKMKDDDLAEVRNSEIGFVFQQFNLISSQFHLLLYYNCYYLGDFGSTTFYHHFIYC